MSKSLNDVEWKLFSINNIIDNINIAKSSDFGKLKEGQTVFIGRQETNNGIQGFVDSNYNENANCITISMVATKMMSFWQSWDFATSQNILILRNCNFNKYNAKFICSILNKYILTKYDYGKPVKLGTFPKEKIMLPINSKGEPDYEFMEEYIREKETELKQEYKTYIQKRVAQLQKKVDIENKEWKNFEINDIFSIKSGKRLTKSDMHTGNIPFVSASAENNGITNFINNKNDSIDSNVLGVNYDGNGGMVISFYHPYKTIFSDSVKRFHLKNIDDDKYILLFCKMSILKQRDKYRYGYKFNETRMKRQNIMLPINSKNEPDYEFMHNYMLYLEQKKILEYLEYINE